MLSDPHKHCLTLQFGRIFPKFHFVRKIASF
jgi:hypothetical protein